MTSPAAAPAPRPVPDLQTAVQALLQEALAAARDQAHPCDRDNGAVLVKSLSPLLQDLHAAHGAVAFLRGSEQQWSLVPREPSPDDLHPLRAWMSNEQAQQVWSDLLASMGIPMPHAGRYTDGYNAAMTVMMDRLNLALADRDSARQTCLDRGVELAELQRKLAQPAKPSITDAMIEAGAQAYMRAGGESITNGQMKLALTAALNVAFPGAAPSAEGVAPFTALLHRSRGDRQHAWGIWSYVVPEAESLFEQLAATRPDQYQVVRLTAVPAVAPATAKWPASHAEWSRALAQKYPAPAEPHPPASSADAGTD